MDFDDPLADRVHNGDRHAVACLLVKLGIGIDGGSFVKHFVGKALQSPALTGRQFADSSAADRHALIAGGIKRLRAAFPDAPSTGLAIRKSQVDTVAALCILISCISSALNRQSLFAGIAGAEVNAVFILRIQAKGGFSALFETASVLPLILTVRGQNSTTAIKNAGAFAPVAYPDFVIACDQAFGMILFPYFRLAPF